MGVSGSEEEVMGAGCCLCVVVVGPGCHLRW